MYRFIGNSFSETCSFEYSFQLRKFQFQLRSQKKKYNNISCTMIIKHFYVRTELKLQAIRYKRQQESIKQIDSDMKNIFELSFNERISKELLNEWANQCKLGELKSQQEFSKKEEWFTKNWMTEKPVNQHNSEKDANNKERFKRSTHYKTFNRRDLIRNQNNNFRHRNNRNNFNKGFQNNFDRRNHLENENPLRRLRKQPLELQGDEEHEDIPENIPEDSLVDILAAVHSRTSSTETIIVPETQQTNESFLLQTPSH